MYARAIIRYILWFIVASPLLSGTPAAVAANEFCIERPCFLRATDRPLPSAPKSRNGTEFAVGKLRLTLPDKLKKVAMPAKNLLSVTLNNQARLTIRLVDNDDLASLVPIATRGQKFTLSASKIPQIVFEKTPEDAEPAEGNDKSIWRSMLIRKKLLFTSKSHLVHYAARQIDIYVADGADGPFAMLALKDGGTYIEIQGKHFPLNEFEKWIARVEAN